MACHQPPRDRNGTKRPSVESTGVRDDVCHPNDQKERAGATRRGCRVPRRPRESCQPERSAHGAMTSVYKCQDGKRWQVFNTSGLQPAGKDTGDPPGPLSDSLHADPLPCRSEACAWDMGRTRRNFLGRTPARAELLGSGRTFESRRCARCSPLAGPGSPRLRPHS